MNCDGVASHISRWLEDYCKDAGLSGFVIGVSGGVDSAVTSTLCAETKLPVLALNLPIHQEHDQHGLSIKHIDWLENRFANAQGIEVDLTAAFDTLSATLPEEVRDDLTLANTRSRLRMTALHAFSSHHQMLVVGTGNKVEDFGIGFFTKYGDGGVDVSPIADLLKSEVYELAAHLGVAQAIQDAPPTDGLWTDARTDETQIGASYEEIEWAMKASQAGVEESALTERQAEVIEIYRRLNAANHHKMIPIPICNIPEDLKEV